MVPPETVMVAVAPGAMAPRLTERLVPLTVNGLEGEMMMLILVRAVGKASLTTTAEAELGPRLVTLVTSVRLLVTTSGLGKAATPTARSAAGPTEMAAVEELLMVMGSTRLGLILTTAELAMSVPVAVVRAVIMAVARPPAA